MCDAEAEDEDTQRVSNTYSNEFIEKLMEQYDAALQPNQAVRMAVQEAVNRNEDNEMVQHIAKNMIDLMREEGGEWENRQFIRIDSADVSIEEANGVETGDE